MEIIQHDVKLKGKDQPVHLYSFSDVHCGAENFNEELFRKYIQIIADDPFALVIGAGDMIDAVNPHDAKRFSYDTLPDEILTGKPSDIKKKLKDISRFQADKFIKMVKPIAKKIVGFTIGNHEEKLQQYYNSDAHGYICDRLGVKDLGFTCIINLRMQAYHERSTSRRLYRIFVTHGCQGGRTAGAKSNSLARLTNIFDVDLVLQGHSHTPGTETTVRIGTTSGNPPKIVRRECRGVNLGSFTLPYKEKARTYDEKKLYNPSPALFYRVDIKAFHGISNLPMTIITEILRG